MNEFRVCFILGLDHPCIIKIKEVIEDSRFVVFVLEYAKGGELFDFVLQEYKSELPFNENLAKFQFYQLLSAIEYLHIFSRVLHFLYRVHSKSNVKH